MVTVTVTVLYERSFSRGTSALHLNESTWIIDGFNELVVDFLFALVLFLDSTLFFLDQTNEFHVNPIATQNQTQASITAASTCRLIQMQGWCSSYVRNLKMHLLIVEACSLA